MSSRRHRRARPKKDIGLTTRLLAVGIGAIVAFALCEVALRVAYPSPPATSRQPPLMFQPRAGLDFLHVPGQVGWLGDGIATINALGLRGPLPAEPKPSEVFRVLTVGDSTTFGWGVGDSDTYAAELHRLLTYTHPRQQIDVVNAGVAGYDLEHQENLLKELVPALQPDVVLIGLHHEDLRSDRVPRSASATTAGGPVVTDGFVFEPEAARWNWLTRTSRVFYTARQVWLEHVASDVRASDQVRWERAMITGDQAAVTDPTWPEIERRLREIAEIGRAHRFSVGVVTMPMYLQVTGQSSSLFYQDHVRAIARQFGLLLVDPLASFIAQPDRGSLFIPYDRSHFSRLGYAEVAGAAAESLRGLLNEREVPLPPPVVAPPVAAAPVAAPAVP